MNKLGLVLITVRENTHPGVRGNTDQATGCYGLHWVPLNPYVDIPTPSGSDVTMFGDGAFDKVIKLT